MDYPVPDPSWDYATIYHKAQQARQHLEEAIAAMSVLEEAHPDTDAKVGRLLEIAGELCMTAANAMTFKNIEGSGE
ncbi:MAG: hypothetical protein SAK29_02285 [Scytonema sp. PMC 1069.18]|nr:hypothetical protein [Scytonema sp. PMC 1069.18]MEC4879834.1 hypothetical protein [Scytonema sp. PMC 1070.18]